ncbi:MAG: hypothetical protein FWD14_03110 [Treponema sp.]|nr:hypothetical protein [Treponema sp.]
MGFFVSYIFIIGIIYWIVFGILEHFGILTTMQSLIGKIYSISLEVLMWIIPIKSFFICGFLLRGAENKFHIGYAILGLIAGLIFDLVLFGINNILLNMRASLKNIEEKIGK